MKCSCIFGHRSCFDEFYILPPSKELILFHFPQTSLLNITGRPVQGKFYHLPKTGDTKAGAGLKKKKKHLWGRATLSNGIFGLMSHCFLNSEKHSTIVLM